MVLDILVVLALILLNGFFAMAELALVSARKPRLGAMAAAGRPGAASALKLAEHPGRFLSSVQIGITLIGVLAGAFSGARLAGPVAEAMRQAGLVAHIADPLAVAVVVAAVTYLSLIVGELVPKQLALRDPERISSLVAPPMAAVARVAAPAVWLLEVSSRTLLRLMRLPSGTREGVSEEEIRALIAEAETAGVVEPVERRMMHAVMRLADRSVRGVMTPRQQVEWLDLDAEPDVLLDRLRAGGHARLPVGRGSVDEIVGVVAAREVLSAAIDTGKVEIERFVRPLTVLHDRMDALDALEVLKTAPIDMAIVVDEYGTFEGILTAADLLYAIAGPPVDDDEPDALRRADGTWLIDAMKPVEEVAELLRLPLPPRRDYHTLAGLMLERLRRLPRLGDAIETGGWRLEVVDMDGRRIDKVLAAALPSRAGKK